MQSEGKKNDGIFVEIVTSIKKVFPVKVVFDKTTFYTEGGPMGRGESQSVGEGV